MTKEHQAAAAAISASSRPPAISSSSREPHVSPRRAAAHHRASKDEATATTTAFFQIHRKQWAFPAARGRRRATLPYNTLENDASGFSAEARAFTLFSVPHANSLLLISDERESCVLPVFFPSSFLLFRGIFFVIINRALTQPYCVCIAGACRDGLFFSGARTGLVVR